MTEVEYYNSMQSDQKKLAAFYKCYPMVKHVEDPLHRATWETFSHIWDLAVTTATQPLEVPEVEEYVKETGIHFHEYGMDRIVYYINSSTYLRTRRSTLHMTQIADFVINASSNKVIKCRRLLEPMLDKLLGVKNGKV